MDLIVADLKRKSYQQTLDLQRELQQQCIQGWINDTLLIVEHDPVLTMGKRGHYSNVTAPESVLNDMGIDIVEVERGGDVTYHGPGQIVGYPIVDLHHFDKDIKEYVSKIQDVIIRVLKDGFGITGTKRTKEQTGVWVGDQKIAAIGISVKKWVTMHGFALNVNTDLSHFDLIVPCGLSGMGVTSVSRLSNKKIDYKKTCKMVIESFADVFGYTPQFMDPAQLLGMIKAKEI